MTRYPRSANTLTEELRAAVPDLEFEADDLDGLNVYRTFRYTSETLKGLDDVVSVVADDRIVLTKSIANGVEVTFNSRTVADQREGFGVAQVADDLLKKRPKRKARTTPKKDED
jgi:hypothetical protein